MPGICRMSVCIVMSNVRRGEGGGAGWTIAISQLTRVIPEFSASSSPLISEFSACGQLGELISIEFSACGQLGELISIEFSTCGQLENLLQPSFIIL